MAESRCKNCGKPISRVNYALGPEWMHGGGPRGDQYPVSGHDMFAAYRECRTTVAEPADEQQAESVQDDRVHALTISDLTLCGLEMGWGRSGSFSRSHVTCGDCTAERIRRYEGKRGNGNG